MPTLLIENIGRLMLVPPGPVAGPRMKSVPAIDDAYLQIDDGKIAAFGPMSDAPQDLTAAAGSGDVDTADARGRAACQRIDAGGGCVIPGLIDCHTHAVFAGTREHEFVMKIEGRSYLDILQSGGGILTTVAAVRAATVDELVAAAEPRLRRMLARGVTTVEIKSGYGLTVEDELKMLRAGRKLGERLPMEIVGTYLAAHTIPAEFRAGGAAPATSGLSDRSPTHARTNAAGMPPGPNKPPADRADEYIDSVSGGSVFETIRREGLAEFADAFCERGAFTVEQSRRFLSAAARHGLRPKLHADQLSQMGASALAAELGAISADHLECIDDAGIEALRRAGVVPVLLPGCSLFLHSQPANARRLIDAGLPVAQATDLNPGSCMIESLPLILSLGCTLLRMTPIESLVACTANAAAALGRSGRLGAIAVGHQADLVILDVPNVERMAYEVGRDCVRMVIKKGCIL